MTIIKQYTEETKQNGTNQNSIPFDNTAKKKLFADRYVNAAECKITLGGHTHKKHR